MSNHHTKPDIVVTITGIVPVTVSTTYVPGIVPERPATQLL
jgi:hypothetical protein